jgi:hypothetical protein
MAIEYEREREREGEATYREKPYPEHYKLRNFCIHQK